MSIEDEANFATFRDCISVAVIEGSQAAPAQVVKTSKSSKRIRPARASQARGKSQNSRDHAFETGTPAELAEFVEYIAEETWQNLPAELKDLTYDALQDRKLAETYALPISSDLVEKLANILPITLTDTLTTYRLVHPPTSDLSSFLTPILTSFLAYISTPPPLPASTRASACEICDRDWITLTYHHLIPKAVHAKVLKRGWHPESRLNDVAWLCRACHSFVHRMAGNEELAREWYDVERILEREDVERWRKWVGGVRWKKR
jgi:hypothetical protein